MAPPILLLILLMCVCIFGLTVGFVLRAQLRDDFHPRDAPSAIRSTRADCLLLCRVAFLTRHPAARSTAQPAAHSAGNSANPAKITASYKSGSVVAKLTVRTTSTQQ